MSSLREILLRHEDLRLKPYRDSVGKLSIGVGRNLDDVGLSREEALLLLDNDILRAQTGVIRELPWSVELDRPRFEVLVNMAFNMGVGGLLEFKKFLSALQAGHMETAAKEMLDSQWSQQVGRRADELAQIVRTGEDPFGRKDGGGRIG